MLFLVAALGLLLGSAVAALVTSRLPRLSTGLGAAGAVVGCSLGLIPTLQGLTGSRLEEFEFPWSVPFGRISLGIDALSAAILLPLFVLSALAAVYGREYLLAHTGRRGLGPAAFFLNVLIASMALVVTARNGLLLLVAWEMMTLASYMLVTFDDRQAEVRRAGWIYLVAAHIGVTSLLALFLLVDRDTESLAFETFGTLRQLGPGAAALLFALALVGFGVKAGVVPLHIWLPEAHAAAPSHVSALMSAVLINLGLYGILRTLGWLTPAAWWAPTLISLGSAGAITGISLALWQRDLKRVLAYSSVENMGLVLLGLGLGYWGVTRGDDTLAALGFGAAFLHLWNHALMKGLLFFCAGNILHGTGTKDLERLGGLLKPMPWTGAAMLLGAASIAALPPLNGFVSEWLLYSGLIHGGLAGGLTQSDLGGLLALIAAGGLAFVGALTLLAFVRLTGIALLGQPRVPLTTRPHEPGLSMRLPILVLAAGCVAVGLVPLRVLALLAPAVEQVAGRGPGLALQGFDTLRTLGACNLTLWLTVGGLGALFLLRTRRAARDQTWGCGYPAGTPRIQYTARSFSELFAEHLLPPPLSTRVAASAPQGFFPGGSSFSSDCSDPLTRRVYEPFFSGWATRFARLRWLQQGFLPLYVLYILAVVVLGLGWLSTRSLISP